MTRLRLFSIAWAGVAVACGGGSSEVEFADYGDELTAAACDDAVKCGDVGTFEECESSFLVSGFLAQVQIFIDSGSLSYDAKAAGKCLDSAAVCDRSTAAPEACDNIFQGNVADGEACLARLECASGGDCDFTGCEEQCCAGVCQPPIALDQACELFDTCAEGLYCTASLFEPGTCKQLNKEGEACEFRSCESGTFCHDTTFVCTVPSADGESCDPAFGGGAVSCDSNDHWCDSSNVCSPRALPEEACSIFGPFELDSCVNYAVCIDAVCVALPGLGDACEDDSAVSCLGDLECISGTCQAPMPREPCEHTPPA